MYLTKEGVDMFEDRFNDITPDDLLEESRFNQMNAAVGDESLEEDYEPPASAADDTYQENYDMVDKPATDTNQEAGEMYEKGPHAGAYAFRTPRRRRYDQATLIKRWEEL